MIATAIYRTQLFLPIILFLTGYAILAFSGLRNYVDISSVNFLLGIMMLPFLNVPTGEENKSLSYWLVALVFTLLGILLPGSTFLYFAISSACLSVLGVSLSRQGLLPFIVLFLASPIFNYVASAFSFPIRLGLSELAGKVLSCIDQHAGALGNVIIFNNREYSVDPGCMGLKMMETSLILGLMVMVIVQRKWKKQLPVKWVIIYLVIIVILNILSNLTRIVILVMFDWAPGTFLHEMAGLICLFVYVLLPSHFIVNRLTGKFAIPMRDHSSNWQQWTVGKILSHLFLFVAVSALTWKTIRGQENFLAAPGSAWKWKDYQASWYAPGILKLDNKSSLTYIKYLRGFYDSDHSPMLCWTGSGYVFDHIEKKSTAGGSIYTGQLTRNGEKLFSAWWYGNGGWPTTSQWTWRWDMISGSTRYAVVNVTCASKDELEKSLTEILEQNKLDPLFKNSISINSNE